MSKLKRFLVVYRVLSAGVGLALLAGCDPSEEKDDSDLLAVLSVHGL